MSSNDQTQIPLTSRGFSIPTVDKVVITISDSESDDDDDDEPCLPKRSTTFISTHSPSNGSTYPPGPQGPSSSTSSPSILPEAAEVTIDLTDSDSEDEGSSFSFTGKALFNNLHSSKTTPDLRFSLNQSSIPSRNIVKTEKLSPVDTISKHVTVATPILPTPTRQLDRGDFNTSMSVDDDCRMNISSFFQKSGPGQPVDMHISKMSSDCTIYQSPNASRQPSFLPRQGKIRLKFQVSPCGDISMADATISSTDNDVCMFDMSSQNATSPTKREETMDLDMGMAPDARSAKLTTNFLNKAWARLSRENRIQFTDNTVDVDMAEKETSLWTHHTRSVFTEEAMDWADYSTLSSALVHGMSPVDTAQVSTQPTLCYNSQTITETSVSPIYALTQSCKNAPTVFSAVPNLDQKVKNRSKRTTTQRKATAKSRGDVWCPSRKRAPCTMDGNNDDCCQEGKRKRLN